MTTERRLQRLIDAAEGLLKRLNTDEPLSYLLPEARRIADLAARQTDVHWLDFEIYGAGRVPGQANPFADEKERAGFFRFWALHECEDISKITIDSVLNTSPFGQRPDMPRGYLIHQSIPDLERIIDEFQDFPDDYARAHQDEVFKMKLLHSGQRRVLPAVRAAVYQLVSEVIDWASEEHENLGLIGPDYRFVLDKLSALDTEVGDELRSALADLHSENPADWSAACLLCRKVITELGPRLFPHRLESYISNMAKKELDLTGEKEKNRLLAHIDTAWAVAENDATKEGLERCADLVIEIYERGSAGKRAVRHAHAQQVVVDTFEMVAILASTTGLEPVPNEPATNYA